MKTTRLELETLELHAVLKMRLAAIAELFSVNDRLLSLPECATIRKKLLAYENTLRSATLEKKDRPRRAPTNEFPVRDGDVQVNTAGRLNWPYVPS